MNKMRLLIIFLLPLFFFGMNGCTTSDSGDNGNTTNQKLGFIDIKDAAYLYIDNPDTKSKSTGGSTLLKITPDGTVKEVTYKDREGNEYTNTTKPTNIINASDNYVIIVFDSENYLVRKSDGTVYLLPIQENEGYSYIYSAITMDSEENMYFIVYNNQRGQKTIIKVNVSDLQKLTYEKLTPAHHNPENFLIDKNNNLFYSESGHGGSMQTIYILNKGSISKLQAYSFWTGVDGFCYIHSRENLNEGDGTNHEYIYKITINDSNIVYELLDSNNEYWGALSGGRTYRINNQLYIIDFRYLEQRDKCKVFNITSKEHLGSDIYSIPGYFFPYHIDSKYIYSTPDDNDFYRFNPESGDFKKLYTHNNDYEIYGDIKVKNGIITYTAFKLSENKNLMIEINGFDGEMRQTDLQSSNKCVVLEKIN